MDFDPREYDSRDDERFAPDRGRGGNSDRDGRDLDDNSRLSDVASRDRDDSDAREAGRGPGDSRESQSDERGRDARLIAIAARHDDGFAPRKYVTRRHEAGATCSHACSSASGTFGSSMNPCWTRTLEHVVSEGWIDRRSSRSCGICRDDRQRTSRLCSTLLQPMLRECGRRASRLWHRTLTALQNYYSKA